jgi:DHA1 family bicyclomycin/chloramphenicol resistance-like MFS transporter
MASIVPALPVLGTAFDADAGSLQFIVSGYLLGLGLFQPIQGLLCDRFGRRPVLLAGVTLFACASLAATLADSLPLLAAARTLQAMGVSVATVVTRAIVRDTHGPEEGAVALAFITAVMGVAPIVAPIAGGFASSAWGWRGVFALHAGIAAALLLWMLALLRESRPPATQAMGFSQLLVGFAVLLRDPVFRGYSLTYSFVSAGGFAFITVGAALFGQLFGTQPEDFGLLWAVLASAYLLGAAAAGQLSRRYGSRTIIGRGLQLNLLAATAFVAAALLPQPSQLAFMLALMLQTASNGLTSPLCLAGCVSERPDLAGVASGLSSATAMIVSMLCAAASGLAFNGGSGSVAVLTAVCAAGAWIAARPALRAAGPRRNSTGGR